MRNRDAQNRQARISFFIRLPSFYVILEDMPELMLQRPRPANDRHIRIRIILKSGTAKLLYLVHRSVSSIQDWEVEAGKAFVQKHLCA